MVRATFRRARVRHWVPAERMRVAYFLNWFYWSGITNAAMEIGRRQPSRSLLGVPAHLVRQFAQGLAGGSGVRRSVAACPRLSTGSSIPRLRLATLRRRWGLVQLG